MKQLNINEIDAVCGGINYGSAIDAASVIIGGYFGSSIAYIETLMTMVSSFGPAGHVVTYTPNTLILTSGIILGASIGFAISHGLQLAYYSENN